MIFALGDQGSCSEYVIQLRQDVAFKWVESRNIDFHSFEGFLHLM